jgi:Peroxidase, family 2
MANHGYLPHNGIGTIQDFITGTGEAFGMGKPTYLKLSILVEPDYRGRLGYLLGHLRCYFRW